MTGFLDLVGSVLRRARHRSHPVIRAAVVVAIVSISGCANGDGPASSVVASSPRSSPMDPAPSASLGTETVPPGDTRLVEGPLQPGTYRIEGIEPAPLLTFPSGWEVEYVLDAGAVGFLHGAVDGLGESALNVHATSMFTHVIDPETGGTSPVPDDFASWLSSHPYLEVIAEPHAVTVGGVEAIALDTAVALGREGTAAGSAEAGYTPAICRDGDCLNFEADAEYRWILFHRSGIPAWINVLAFGDDRIQDVVDRVAAPVLSSLRFER